MSELAKRQENGSKGENRTQAILVDRFWLLKRSVDIEGADFLVQIPVNTLDELYSEKYKIQVLGVIQAKYFQEKNQVKIDKNYIEDSEGVRTEFFAFIHTDDDNGEEVKYFFSANEIKKEFYEDKEGKYYCFSITNTRDYKEYKNLKKKDILDKIENGILVTKKERNRRLIENIYLQINKSNYEIYKKDDCEIIETQNAKYTNKKNGYYSTIEKEDKSTGTISTEYVSLGNIDMKDMLIIK